MLTPVRRVDILRQMYATNISCLASQKNTNKYTHMFRSELHLEKLRGEREV